MTKTAKVNKKNEVVNHGHRVFTATNDNNGNDDIGHADKPAPPP